MYHGFLRAAAICPEIKVADPVYNSGVIVRKISEAEKRGVKLMVFPELCLTGYTCGDLFFQKTLQSETLHALDEILIQSGETDALIFIGLPLEYHGALYDVAAVLNHGNVLGFVPKTNILKHGEIPESRYFAEGRPECEELVWGKRKIPFGTSLLFSFEPLDHLLIGCEIGSDLSGVCPPSQSHTAAGAQVIVNLSAKAEIIGSYEYQELLVKAESARLAAGYILSGNGPGESSQDLVFSGHGLIAENGKILEKTCEFSEMSAVQDLDIQRLNTERLYRQNKFQGKAEKYRYIPFSLNMEEIKLKRKFSRTPFLSEIDGENSARCRKVLSVSAYGLKKRMEHTGLSKVVLGISGGLDSTLAVLTAAYTFDLLKIKRRNIIAVTMPCFGTTGHTLQNAADLASCLHADFRVINIEDSVKVHFKAIGQSCEIYDAVYENAQARERTQVLMDLANREQALVIGTGDLSELALGWTTYNGDQMSMYGVNSDIPKTLVSELVEYCAENCGEKTLSEVLKRILRTPVSPELLPPDHGEISQKTEDLIGPYELHDFFLYYVLRWGFAPDKIYRLAQDTFKEYDKQVILKWLDVFYHRFFSQQFKRSCMPDGPRVGSVSLSPRVSYLMPSDADMGIWLSQLKNLTNEDHADKLQKEN